MALDTIISFEHANIQVNDHLVLSDVNMTVNRGESSYISLGKLEAERPALSRP